MNFKVRPLIVASLHHDHVAVKKMLMRMTDMDAETQAEFRAECELLGYSRPNVTYVEWSIRAIILTFAQCPSPPTHRAVHCALSRS